MMEHATSPVWTSPTLRELWEQNQATRSRLRDAVASLSEKQITFRPSPSKWSIGEILDHLCLAERSMTRTISRLLQRAAGLGMIGEPGSMATPHHTIDAAAYGRPASAPDAVVPSPERPLIRLLADLDESRERLHEVCVRADGRVVGEVRLAHVQLGELNFYQWLSVVGAHDAKHLAQIEAVSRHPDFPSA